MILCDRDIRNRCVGVLNPMVEPFCEGVSEPGFPSWGLSSAGYDLRLASEIWEVNDEYEKKFPICPRTIQHTEINNQVYLKYEAKDTFELPPRGSILARSMEYLRIPKDILGICLGKSSWARCDVIVNTTPLEPEWEGYLTIEISNTSSWPVTLYVGKGIAQLNFHLLSGVPDKTYADKLGIYQGQTSVTAARVRS